jgi:polyisoprenoid-binding protein YceI
VISEVGGKFKDFDGQVKSNGDGFDGSEIQFKAFVESINTDNEQRDGHLKSDDFFNAAEYPELKFDGKLVKNGSGYILKGEMTIRDVTKPIAFDVQYNGTVTDPWGNTKAGFKITGSVNRFDYGLKWNTLMEAGGAVVDEEINIVCNVELQKQV